MNNAAHDEVQRIREAFDASGLTQETAAELLKKRGCPRSQASICRALKLKPVAKPHTEHRSTRELLKDLLTEMGYLGKENSEGDVI